MPIPKTERDTLAIFPYSPFLHPQSPPLEDICDSPLICVSVNATWASWIMGALVALEQPDLWLGTEEEKDATIEKVRRIMSMFSNPCADEAFEIRRYFNEWHNFQLTLLGMYDGTPESIDEDTPNTNFDSDSGDVGTDAAVRDAALCAACRALVATTCAQWVVQKQQYAQGLSLIITLLTVGLPFGGFIIGLVVTGALNWIASIDINALQDELAQEQIACCIYDFLKGKSVTRDNFCDFAEHCKDENPSGNAGIIAHGFTVSDICTTGNYIAFLKNLAEQFRYGRLDLLESCPCETWAYTFFGPEDLPPFFDPDDAVFDSGNNWYYWTRAQGIEGATIGGTIRLENAFPFTITRLAMTFATVVGEPFSARPSSVGHDETEQLAVTNTTTSGTYNVDTGTISPVEVLQVYFNVQSRSHEDNSPENANDRVELRSITIEGRGFDPFV